MSDLSINARAGPLLACLACAIPKFTPGVTPADCREVLCVDNYRSCVWLWLTGVS